MAPSFDDENGGFFSAHEAGVYGIDHSILQEFGQRVSLLHARPRLPYSGGPCQIYRHPDLLASLPLRRAVSQAMVMPQWEQGFSEPQRQCGGPV